jgi:hypothetical protein
LQLIRTAVILLFTLPAFGHTWCQIPEGVSTDPVPGVAISIAPVAGALQTRTSLKVRVSLSNSTRSFLVQKYPVSLDPVLFDIHDTAGKVPAETDLGCKRHMSPKCGPSVKIGGPVSMVAMAVEPGQTISFDWDLSSEYKLEDAKSYMVDAGSKLLFGGRSQKHHRSPSAYS